MSYLLKEKQLVKKLFPKKKMKNLRVGGGKYFSSKEYLDVTQVKSLFSRYLKKIAK